MHVLLGLLAQLHLRSNIPAPSSSGAAEQICCLEMTLSLDSRACSALPSGIYAKIMAFSHTLSGRYPTVQPASLLCYFIPSKTMVLCISRRGSLHFILFSKHSHSFKINRKIQELLSFLIHQSSHSFFPWIFKHVQTNDRTCDLYQDTK